MHASSRQSKRLKDYAPPDYLIEEVVLDVALAPKAARVSSKLRLRPNAKVARGGRSLRLDGEDLKLERLALDGKKLTLRHYALGESSLTISRVPSQPFTLEIV